jgi:hypothetical protein
MPKRDRIQIFRQLLKLYWSLLLNLKQIWSVAFLIRFSIAMSVLGSVAVLASDQSLEALRVMVADTQRTLRPLLVFALAALFLCLMSWYWARVLLYIFRPRSLERTDATGWAVRNLPRLFGVLPLVAISAAFYRARNPKAVEAAVTQSRLLAMSLAAIIAAVGLYLFLFFRNRWIKRPKVGSAKEGHVLLISQLGKSSRIVLLLTTLLWILLFIVFSTSAVRVAAWFGPVAIVFLCVGTWVAFGSILAYLGKRSRLPIFSLLIIIAIVFSALDINDNHMIRHWEVTRTQLPPEFSQTFPQWLEGRGDKNEYSTYPVFLISAEGGGLRAASFTALVLSAIQDRCPAFAQHVYAISGVSGGSIGAAVFAGLAARYTRNQAGLPCNLNLNGPGDFEQKANAVLKRDYLSPLLAAGLYPDLVQRFLPIPVQRFDRALALEQSLEQSWTASTGGYQMSQPFYDLWPDFAHQSVPALFLNTTRVETGDRMVISNLYPLDERFDRLESLADVDLSLTPRLSTAACLSGRFPLITPAGYIPVGKDARGRPVEKKRYVDGGYFENSGAATIYEMLASLRVGEAESARPYQVIVIRIGNSVVPDKSAPPKASDYKRQGLGEVLSPIRTLLNTREARGNTAVKQMETAITSLQDRHQVADLFQFEIKESVVELPLGWLLSDEARAELVRQLGRPRNCEFERDIENDCEFGKVIAALVNKQ